MKTYAFILAGGKGTRLDILAFHRDKPAVMFAGKYRIIDFCLSNLANSNILDIGILTHKDQVAINEYINSGKSWYQEVDNINKVNLELLHPKDKYLGTADAIYQNLNILKDKDIDYVLILSGDQIYKMDYSKLILEHIKNNSDLTIASIIVDKKDTHRFGILETDRNLKVKDFKEKPIKTNSCLASMGIYVFKKDLLINTLNELVLKETNLDFGKHVIPYILNNKNNNVYSYIFDGYWQDVGTYDSYLNASLDLNKHFPDLVLDDKNWKIYTNYDEDTKAKITTSSYIESSLISNGAIIKGSVINSIVSPGVIIEKGVQIRDSIILNNVKIEKGCTIYRSIIDKNSHIGKNCIIGFGDKNIKNENYPELLKTGITVIEKNTTIKDNVKIGTNCRIFNKADFTIIDEVLDGKTLE